MSRAARLAAWSTFLVLTLRLLHGPAFGHLSVPLDSLDGLAAWANRTAPSAMGLALVRLAAIAAAWYLTGATALAVVADLAGWRRTARVVAALSPAVVRRLASRSAGVGLAAGALLAVTPMPTRLAATPADASTGQAENPPPPTATMTGLPTTSPPTTTRPTNSAQPGTHARPADPRPGNPATPAMTRLRGAPSATTTSSGAPASAAELTLTDPPTAPTMTRLPGTTPTGTTQPSTAENATPSAEGTTPGASTPPTMTRLATESEASAPEATATMSRLPGDVPTARPASTTAPGDPAALWPVTQGDSFWSIAHETLADHLGHRPADDDVSRYWRHLIAANRHRLLDPANCDLLVPGQQLELPPPA